jgi:hypothetical protein
LYTDRNESSKEEKKMNNRTTAIILTVVAVLLCGCPGIIACVFGGLIAAGVPFTTTVNGSSSTQPFPVAYGIGLFCLAVILVVIPVVVGVLTLRKKKPAADAGAVPPTTPQEPLPPAS